MKLDREQASLLNTGLLNPVKYGVLDIESGIVKSGRDSYLLTPYNQGLLADMKRSIAYRFRRWDNDRRYWVVRDNRDVLEGAIARHLGGGVAIYYAPGVVYDMQRFKLHMAKIVPAFRYNHARDRWEAPITALAQAWQALTPKVLTTERARLRLVEDGATLKPPVTCRHCGKVATHWYIRVDGPYRYNKLVCEGLAVSETWTLWGACEAGFVMSGKTYKRAAPDTPIDLHMVWPDHRACRLSPYYRGGEDQQVAAIDAHLVSAPTCQQPPH